MWSQGLWVRVPSFTPIYAGIAQLAERNVANVEVTGSRPVARSMKSHEIVEHNKDTYYINKCEGIELDYSLLATFVPEQVVRQIRCARCGELVEVKIRPS